MAKIEYVEGDATQPVGHDNKLIIHCCNDVGAWGAGFVKALSERSPLPELFYRRWHKSGFGHSQYLFGRSNGIIDRYSKDSVPFVLGQIQTVQISETSEVGNTYVVNMIGQRNIGVQSIRIGDKAQRIQPIRYDSIAECLMRTAQIAVDYNASIHCPRFGCGLAGGEWEEIERLINDILIDVAGLNVTVYDLKT